MTKWENRQHLSVTVLCNRVKDALLNVKVLHEVFARSSCNYLLSISSEGRSVCRISGPVDWRNESDPALGKFFWFHSILELWDCDLFWYCPFLFLCTIFLFQYFEKFSLLRNWLILSNENDSVIRFPFLLWFLGNSKLCLLQVCRIIAGWYACFPLFMTSLYSIFTVSVG